MNDRSLHLIFQALYGLLAFAALMVAAILRNDMLALGFALLGIALVVASQSFAQRASFLAELGMSPDRALKLGWLVWLGSFVAALCSFLELCIKGV